MNEGKQPEYIPPYKERSVLDSLLAPFTRFTKTEAFGGILLIIATIIAVVWANSRYGDFYRELWQYPLTIGFGDNILSKPLILWINDGLMAMFFFVVGLEIKREVILGELSSVKKALFPFIAAVGGMLVPALIYITFNYGEPGMRGWGIPMATDIAFSLGLLMLLGPRVPLSLKILITAIAVVDDLGAVLVIALFYSSKIYLVNLAIGAVFLFTMLGMNIAGVRNPWSYALIGIAGLWMAFLLSGVHATVAGILAAFTIPVKRELKQRDFISKMRLFLGVYESSTTYHGKELANTTQLETAYDMKDLCDSSVSPLQRLEYKMHPWVTYFIMPVFALSNAGIEFSGKITEIAFHPVAIGVFLGLLLGKTIGIFSFSWIAVKIKITDLPKGVSWQQHFGISMLAGVGFTMSLFIAGLAFFGEEMLAAAKIGIFGASLIAGIGALILLKRSFKTE